jgi:hypothetical protein
MYQELADMACEKITAGITQALLEKRPIKAVLDPYNLTSTTRWARHGRIGKSPAMLVTNGRRKQKNFTRNNGSNT